MILRDVLIIGGGIHGCATALNLRHAGASVTLFEKDYAGRHASGVNAGGVRMLSRHVAEIPLSLRSMAIALLARRAWNSTAAKYTLVKSMPSSLP